MPEVSPPKPSENVITFEIIARVGMMQRFMLDDSLRYPGGRSKIIILEEERLNIEQERVKFEVKRSERDKIEKVLRVNKIKILP